MKSPPSKYCARCKIELVPGDNYREHRYSYETEEQPDITLIGLVYICAECADINAKIYEDPDFDEY